MSEGISATSSRGPLNDVDSIQSNGNDRNAMNPSSAAYCSTVARRDRRWIIRRLAGSADRSLDASPAAAQVDVQQRQDDEDHDVAHRRGVPEVPVLEALVVGEERRHQRLSAGTALGQHVDETERVEVPAEIE